MPPRGLPRTPAHAGPPISPRQSGRHKRQGSDLVDTANKKHRADEEDEDEELEDAPPIKGRHGGKAAKNAGLVGLKKKEVQPRYINLQLLFNHY